MLLCTLEYADVPGVDVGPDQVSGQVEATSAAADDADLAVGGEGEHESGCAKSHGYLIIELWV